MKLPDLGDIFSGNFFALGEEQIYLKEKNDIKAERKSNRHWTLVYLTQKPQWEGDAVVVELKGKQALCLIPSLAQETLLTPSRTVALNDTIKVRAGNIDIPTLSVNFISL